MEILSFARGFAWNRGVQTMVSGEVPEPPAVISYWIDGESIQIDTKLSKPMDKTWTNYLTRLYIATVQLTRLYIATVQLTRINQVEFFVQHIRGGIMEVDIMEVE